MYNIQAAIEISMFFQSYLSSLSLQPPIKLFTMPFSNQFHDDRIRISERILNTLSPNERIYFVSSNQSPLTGFEQLQLVPFITNWRNVSRATRFSS